MAKTIRMRRNRKGQFVAVGRASNPPHRKKHHRKKHAARRKNWYGAGAVVPMSMNPPGHHKRRRNPPSEILGVPIPNIEDVGVMAVGVAGGLVGPPITQGLLQQFVPASVTSGLGSFGPTLVKGLSYVVPAGIGYAVGGKQGLKYVLVGEAAGFLAGIMQSALTQMLPTPAATGMAGYLRNNRGQLGRTQVRGYIAPGTSRTQLSAFPGARSVARTTRFVSPRR